MASIFLNTDLYAQVDTAGLLAWYPFSGNTNDSTINKNNLGNENVIFTTDRFGDTNSAAFFGPCFGCNTLLIEDAFGLTNTFSYSFWIKPKKLFKNMLLFYNGYIDINGMGLMITPSTTTAGYVLSIVTNTSQFNTSYQVDTNWQYIVLSNSDTGKCKLFANGKLIRVDTTKLFYSSIIGLFTLGALQIIHAGSVSDFYRGAMDDFRIYNRALTNSEIETLYHEGGYVPLTIPSTTILNYKIYPNPMTSQLFIEDAENGDKVRLYDIMGREVYNGAINNKKYIINATELSAGTYLLELIDRYGRRKSMTVVKQ